MILLDTHVLVWLRSDSSRLSKAARKFIIESGKKDALAICPVTLWEAAWEAKKGRIFAHRPIRDVLEMLAKGVSVLPLTAEVIAVAADFPESYPRDPADRMIGATAVANGIPLVTADKRIRQSGVVQTVW